MPAVVRVDRAGVPGAGVAALVVEHLQAVLDQSAHLLGGLEAVVGLLGEGAHDQAVQLRRRGVGGLRRGRRDVLDVLVDHREGGLAGERGPQREEFVEEAARRVQVGAVVDRLAERLLRGEVLRGAHDHAGLGHRGGRAVQGAGDAEVHHLDRAVVGDDDVRRLDVAVHDAVLMRIGERLQHPGDDDQGLLGPGRLGVDEEIADGAALDQLHDDVRHALTADEILAGVVNGHDRMVVEAGHRLGLAREAGLGDRVLGEVGAQQLDRDGPSEPDVLRGEHLSHTAPAESAGEPVPAVPDQPAVTPQLRRI